MSFGPNFVATLDDEVRAFIFISGITLAENEYGEVLPYMRSPEGLDYVCYLHRGDPRTVDYWREVALRCYNDYRMK